MKTTQRQRRLIITDTITLGPNAVVRKKQGNDYAVMFPSIVTKVLTATKAIVAEESGTHFILNTVTAFVTTLPAPLAGMEFFFHIGAIEPTTTHKVVTNASADIIVGNIATTEDALGSVATVTDADAINFIASKAVHGDFAHVWSDGTNWYLDGMCKAQDGMTTTQV